jgi:hypothetical protein
MHSKRWGRAAVAGLVAGTFTLGAAVAHAGTLYRWKTENGTIAFADDARRIPARYRDQAQEIPTADLSTYSRFTPIDSDAQTANAEQLAKRLDTLRAAAAAEPADGTLVVDGGAVATGPVVSKMALQSVQERVGRRQVQTPLGSGWQRTTQLQTVNNPVPVLGLDANSESTHPVVVENLRVKPSDSIVTQHVTVVRQGDRVLSVIRPYPREGSSDWPRLDDLER